MWAVAADVDTLRLITAIEAAAGFGLMAAAITYVLSIYPLTSQLSNAARRVQTQADEPALPVPLLLPGEGTVGHTPHVHPWHRHGMSAGTAVHLHGRRPYARVQGRELQLRLQHSIDQYAIGFLMRDPRCLRRPLDADDARRRWQSLTDAAGNWGVDRPGEDETDLDEFARIVGYCQTFLDNLAEQHLYPPAQPPGRGWLNVSSRWVSASRRRSAGGIDPRTLR